MIKALFLSIMMYAAPMCAQTINVNYYESGGAYWYPQAQVQYPVNRNINIHLEYNAYRVPSEYNYEYLRDNSINNINSMWNWSYTVRGK